jgi:hypothetical protein
VAGGSIGARYALQLLFSEKSQNYQLLKSNSDRNKISADLKSL